jgi:UDP-2-acetamido-2-deoxy-ribo-hexuluronate aminotransferase
VATYYDQHISKTFIQTPFRSFNSTHVFHQYTCKIQAGRDQFQKFLADHDVPSMIYYPIPLHLQKAYATNGIRKSFPVTEKLSKMVISLPIHTEMTTEQLEYIVDVISKFDR